MLLERLFFAGNKKFFVVFDALAVDIRKMSCLLLTSVKDGDSHIRLHVKEMEELEKQTAEHVRILFTELGRNLITPFDREDIHFLATDLSNIARNILHVTKQIRNYNIDCAEDVTETVARRADEAVGMLAEILNKLKDVRELSRLGAICANIRPMVNKCHYLLDDTIAALLKEEKIEFQLIKMIDHYDSLQKLLKKIDDTVDVCESIIIKYA